ncbi:MAG: hypothetical protein ABIY48_04530 [Acidimicrobiales bacterium]
MLVLVILAAIWAAVLLPPYLQNRRDTRPGDSIATFRTQLSVLERTTPGGRSGSLARLDVGRYDPPTYVPPAARRAPGRAARPAPSQAAMRRAEARRRRRDVFLTLLGAVAVTFVLAVVFGGSVWMLHLAIDLGFLGYVGMLVSLQQQSLEKDDKVRYLAPAPRRTAPEPLLLRRSGS